MCDSYKHKLVAPEFAVRLYQTCTLGGRPFVILDDDRQALNHQNQGSGADVLARAIASLPQDIASMMEMPVHDELVLEVPADRLEEVKCIVTEAMIRAWHAVLGEQMPIAVEAAVGEAWGK